MILWNIYEFLQDQNETAILVASNLQDNVTSRIMAYELLEANPIWQTADLQGYYSYIDVNNMDDDPNLEVVFGVNSYNADSEQYF